MAIGNFCYFIFNLSRDQGDWKSYSEELNESRDPTLVTTEDIVSSERLLPLVSVEVTEL